nr:MAG TPA: hypothetical protein [Caudoviricetes sp.]DAW90460.1 MAG TPA: hypothetical protein [Caudoviricetes sp.]
MIMLSFCKIRHKKALPSYITTVQKGTNFKIK